MRKIIERNGVWFESEPDRWIVLVEIRHVSAFESEFIFESDSSGKYTVRVQYDPRSDMHFTGQDLTPNPLLLGILSHWPGMTLLPWKEHEC